MLEYLGQLFNDKKTFTIFMVTLIVAMFVVLFFIWKPDKKVEEFAKYEQVNIDEKYEEIGRTYLNSLIIEFKYVQKEKILSKLSESYLDYVGLTKVEVIDELFSKKINSFNGLNINYKNGFVVYTTDIVYEDNTTKTMNILEEQPYKYDISFDDFCSYKGEHIRTNLDGIEFEIDSIYSGITKASYEINITNKTNESVTFDISSNRNVQLVLEDGQTYYLTDVVVSNELDNISKNTTINKTFEFSVPFSLQDKVKSIVFKNVKIESDVKDITVEF